MAARGCSILSRGGDGHSLSQQPAKRRISIRFGSGSVWICADGHSLIQQPAKRRISVRFGSDVDLCRPEGITRGLFSAQGDSEHQEDSALGLKCLLRLGNEPRRSRMYWPSPQRSVTQTALLGHPEPLEVSSSGQVMLSQASTMEQEQTPQHPSGHLNLFLSSV